MLLHRIWGFGLYRVAVIRRVSFPARTMLLKAASAERVRAVMGIGGGETWPWFFSQPMAVLAGMARALSRWCGGLGAGQAGECLGVRPVVDGGDACVGVVGVDWEVGYCFRDGGR